MRKLFSPEELARVAEHANEAQQQDALISARKQPLQLRVLPSPR
jgi:hypothetical protein